MWWLIFWPLMTFANSMPTDRPIFPLNEKDSTVIDRYNKILNEFEQELCPPGTREEFAQLFNDYKRTGYYIPLIGDNSLDVETIVDGKMNLQFKLDWIRLQIKYLEQLDNFEDSKKLIKNINDLLIESLKSKEEYDFSSDQAAKERTLVISKEILKKLEKKFFELVNKTPFLLGFKFPVDHLTLRLKYDNLKDSKYIKDIKMANKIYFLRKILEDGAFEQDHKKSDIYLRTTLSTLAIALEKEQSVIEENVRYDLSSILKWVGLELEKGKDAQISKMTEWRQRTEKAIQFYDHLLSINNKEIVLKELEEFSTARFALKKFTQEKQVKVYDFWRKQDEVLAAIFAIESILHNEVGSIDGPLALERSDVVQVILNRRLNSAYNHLDEDDDFKAALKKFAPAIAKAEFTWGNLLFKEGEFSFTYYFIPGSMQTFCPERTRPAERLRKENVQMAIKVLKHPHPEFGADRYFSRASMIGRIDMASLWDKHRPMEENVGPRLKMTPQLLKAYHKHKYVYWYRLKTNDGRVFKIIEIEGKPYAFDHEKKIFHHYRNVHLFRYFAPHKSSP